MDEGKSWLDINWLKICPASYQTLVDDLHRDTREPRLDRFQGSEKDFLSTTFSSNNSRFPSQPSRSTLHSFSIEAEQVVSTEPDASTLFASLNVFPYVNSSRRSSASRVVVLL